MNLSIPTPHASVLTINGGSSSIKFAVFPSHGSSQRRLYGKVERLGTPDAQLTFQDLATQPPESGTLSLPPGTASATWLLDWLAARLDFTTLAAIGHRVVYGLERAEPARITPELLAELRRMCEVDPMHMPAELNMIEAISERHPQLPQVACFDTAFHHAMPRVARMLPIPRRFETMGIKRYGFHGLSYAYLLEELSQIAGTEAALGRVILAHLGSGASLAAVHEGKSQDTTMGFTPASGVPMGTRPGDLDPGVASFIMQREKLTPEQFNHLINHESGLLGVSGTSSDMRDLLACEAQDERAAEAVNLFCYQARKAVGAFAAVLGGVETLVFAGGVGENAPAVRARICAQLGHLGITLDDAANAANAPIISSRTSWVPVHVIRTDEEAMIARILWRFIAPS